MFGVGCLVLVIRWCSFCCVSGSARGIVVSWLLCRVLMVICWVVAFRWAVRVLFLLLVFWLCMSIWRYGWVPGRFIVVV